MNQEEEKAINQMRLEAARFLYCTCMLRANCEGCIFLNDMENKHEGCRLQTACSWNVADLPIIKNYPSLDPGESE